MNIKRIWTWSVVVGALVALLTYVLLFSSYSQKTSTNVETEVVTAAEDTKTEDEESKKEAEINYERELPNPMVEVSKGMRAISLFVEVAPGVSGYVQPNSLVDVVAYETIRDEKTEKEFKSAVLVLEKVKVLASGKSADNKEEATRYQTVTLEVKPEDGVMLSLATRDKDGFYLMLRNDADEQVGKRGYKETREIFKEKKEEEEK